MPHRRQTFFKQKLPLYFDHNFPRNVVDYMRSVRRLARLFRMRSAAELGLGSREDPFHFNYCGRNSYVLVTLDGDFMDDRKYPLAKQPGVIYVVAGRNDVAVIAGCLITVAQFLARFPFPRAFVAQSKFKVSGEQCIMRGLHAKSGQVKTETITYGDTTVREIAGSFGYF